MLTMTTQPSHCKKLLRRVRTLLPLLVVILLTLPALQPLWQPGLQQTDDGAHHLFRLFNLDLAQRSGHLGTRWLADEGFGYGFPVLNFYAPLGYYVGLIFHRLGAGFASTLEWTLAAGLLLAALAMYALAAELFSPWAALLAAAVYTWAPYHLADAWTRGALGELLAFIWLPLLLLALAKIGDQRLETAAQRSEIGDRRSSRGWWAVGWGGISLAGLVLTHNLTLILAAPLLLGWAGLLLAFKAPTAKDRLTAAAQMATLVMLGVLLSAAFWLPALGEVKDVLAGQVTLDFDAWAAAELAPAAQLIELRWDHLYTLAQQPPVLHALPLAQAAIMLAGLAAGVWRWRRLSRAQRLLLVLAATLALFALFMQSAWSRPLWRGIPGLLLLQFPWRWQTLGVLTAALLAAYLAGDRGGRSYEHEASLRRLPAAGAGRLRTGCRGFNRRIALRLLALLVVPALLIPAALAHLPWEPALVPTTDVPLTDANVNRATLALYDFGRGLWLREHGNAWMFEYMPVWALPRRSDFFVSAGPAPATSPLTGVQATPGRQTALEHRFQVSSPAAWTLQLHQFYFPGWQALVDGQPAAVQPTGPLALVGVDLPAGRHDVTLRFGLTPIRRTGWVISAIGLALTAALLWRLWPWPRPAFILAAGLLGLAFLGGGLTLAAAWTQPTAVTPAAVQAQFGDEIALIGFVAPPAQMQSGQDATVTLTWLALRPPTANYKVFVHLVDSQGVTWAQHDGEPGFFFSPTTRWQPGEIMDDHHPLDFAAPAPPGRYQLRVGLYDPVSGQRLSVIGPDGTAIGNEVMLAEFDLRS